jgi:hypothetical protein
VKEGNRTGWRQRPTPLEVIVGCRYLRQAPQDPHEPSHAGQVQSAGFPWQGQAQAAVDLQQLAPWVEVAGAIPAAKSVAAKPNAIMAIVLRMKVSLQSLK